MEIFENVGSLYNTAYQQGFHKIMKNKPLSACVTEVVYQHLVTSLFV